MISPEEIAERNELKDLKVVNPEVNAGNQRITGPRASGLGKDCIRGLILASSLSKAPFSTMRVDKGLELIFAWGDSLHEVAQNTNIVNDASIRRGWWRCVSCNTILGFGAPPAEDYKCYQCGARREAIVYHEHVLEVKGDPFYLGGHLDMLLELKRNVLTVCEYKTCASSVFKDVRKRQRPLPEHLTQGLTYLAHLKRNQSEYRLPEKYRLNEDFFVIIYITKEALKKGDWPFLSFTVFASENKKAMELIEEDLRTYKKGRENFPHDVPLPMEVCSRGNFTSNHASSCQHRVVCARHFMRYQNNA